MSFQAMAWAIKQPLSCQEKMVLLMLSNYADQSGRCFPSMGVLSKECGLSLAQTRKCVSKLEEAKLVRRYKRIRSYGQTSNTFILAIVDPHSIGAPPHSNRVP
jgi:hypothetical protein